MQRRAALAGDLEKELEQRSREQQQQMANGIN